MSGDAELRARLNEELGFYPASVDKESVARHRRKAAAEDDGTAAAAVVGFTGERTEMSEHEEIEARKKKAERGWLVAPERPRVVYSPGEEIEKWYAVIGLRGSAPATERTNR